MYSTIYIWCIWMAYSVIAIPGRLFVYSHKITQCRSKYYSYRYSIHIIGVQLCTHQAARQQGCGAQEASGVDHQGHQREGPERLRSHKKIGPQTAGTRLGL